MSRTHLPYTGADLQDIAEDLGKPLPEVEQDFLLVKIAAQLQSDFPNQLCFKGGFVLRHVYGSERLSVDIDATGTDPARHKLDEADVAQSIRLAGKPQYRIPAITAARNTELSLDFDPVRYRGPLSNGQVAVEVSYREEVCLEPIPGAVGPPYIDPVTIPTMAPAEMLAEKYRALCQRTKETDLLDAADLWAGTAGPISPASVADLIPMKFAEGVVRAGDHANRVRTNVEAMGATFEAAIRARVPAAMEYERAAQLVLSKLAAVFRR